MTSETAPVVYLLRRPREVDPYEDALSTAGYQPVHLPVLEFSYVNEPRLHEFLKSPGSFGGLIVTSPRVVDLLKTIKERDPQLLAPWFKKQSYAVGPSTSGRLTTLGFDVRGSNAGNAEELSRVIIAARPSGRPLLFLCGNRRREMLPKALTRAGVAWQELQVYRTDVSDSIVPADERPGWVVCFSPSGVEGLTQILDSLAHTPRIAAIGPTTAQALRVEGFTVHAVAHEPSAEGVIRALQRAEPTIR